MVIAILLAAGKSTRFGKDKLWMPLLGKPVWYYSLQTLHDHPEVDEVFIVTSEKFIKKIKAALHTYHFRKVQSVIEGGSQRQQSFINGLRAVQSFSTQRDNRDIIMVQNAANPFATSDEYTAAIQAAQKFGAAAVGKKIVETVKEIAGRDYIKTHDREKLRATQTPQAIRYDVLTKALEKAKKGRRIFTDESALVENIGIKVRHIDASPANFKITTPEDYLHAQAILGDYAKDFLVGIGQDSHEFDPNQKGLTLGGIFLKNEQKLAADSDGDVILHAIGNGILQALGKESLGSIATPLFKEKNIRDSKIYLDHILQKMKKRCYSINNIGIMLEGRKPLFDPVSAKMRTSLAKLFSMPEQRIGITATTGKNLTSFGQGKGIQCFAIISLRHHENKSTS